MLVVFEGLAAGFCGLRMILWFGGGDCVAIVCFVRLVKVLGFGFEVLFRDSGIRDFRSLLFKTLLFYFFKKFTISFFTFSHSSSVSSVSSHSSLTGSPPHSVLRFWSSVLVVPLARVKQKIKNLRNMEIHSFLHIYFHIIGIIGLLSQYSCAWQAVSSTIADVFCIL